MLENNDYYRPNTKEELTEILRQTTGKIVAGCTDMLPRMRRGQVPGDCLVDINNIKELHFIREENGQVQIGALATHAELVSSQIIQDASPALAEAAASIGSPQTRNRGTLGGNLANASPAADTAPPLLVLDAGVKLNNDGKPRSVPLEDFFCGPGQTVLTSGEYIEHVFFNRPTGQWGMAFFKLGKRKGMAISVVSAAAFLSLGSDGTIKTARVALGSVAPVPLRSRSTEEFLMDKTPTLEAFQKAGEAVLLDISPINDVRALAEYRRHVAGIAVQRVLEMAWEQAARRIA